MGNTARAEGIGRYDITARCQNTIERTRRSDKLCFVVCSNHCLDHGFRCGRVHTHEIARTRRVDAVTAPIEHLLVSRAQLKPAADVSHLKVKLVLTGKVLCIINTFHFGFDPETLKSLNINIGKCKQFACARWQKNFEDKLLAISGLKCAVIRAPACLGQ